MDEPLLERCLALVATTAYVVLLVVYCAAAVFNDHIEVNVGAIASALHRGQPPYHGVTGLASYELPYGPNVFLVLAGSIAVFGASVFSLKLPCFLACIATGALVFDVLRHRVTRRCASGAWLLFLVYLAYYDESVYWCRPEPFLLFGSAVGVWLVRTHALKRTYLVVLAHAALVAWMVNLKITGILYVLPILVLLAGSIGIARATLAALLGVAMALAVFAWPAFSLGAYATVLSKTARHGLAVGDCVLGASAALFLLGPIAVARWLHLAGPPVAPARPRWPVPYRTLVASVVATCVIAAKPGAGCHHLLPFLPIGIDAFVDGIDGAERTRISAHAARVSTMAGRAVFAIVVVSCAVANVFLLSERTARARGRASEVRTLLAEHAGTDVQMGYSTDAAYEQTFERILIAFDRPLYLDAGSQIDSTGAGLSATQMLGGSVGACRPRIWLLPRGEPFSLRSRYRASSTDEQTVFDPRFRAEFAARYVRIESTETYDVYLCRDGT